MPLVVAYPIIVIGSITTAVSLYQLWRMTVGYWQHDSRMSWFLGYRWELWAWPMRCQAVCKRCGDDLDSNTSSRQESIAICEHFRKTHKCKKEST